MEQKSSSHYSSYNFIEMLFELPRAVFLTYKNNNI